MKLQGKELYQAHTTVSRVVCKVSAAAHVVMDERELPLPSDIRFKESMTSGSKLLIIEDALSLSWSFLIFASPLSLFTFIHQVACSPSSEIGVDVRRWLAALLFNARNKDPVAQGSIDDVERGESVCTRTGSSSIEPPARSHSRYGMASFF